MGRSFPCWACVLCSGVAGGPTRQRDSLPRWLVALRWGRFEQRPGDKYFTIAREENLQVSVEQKHSIKWLLRSVCQSSIIQETTQNFVASNTNSLLFLIILWVARALLTLVSQGPAHANAFWREGTGWPGPRWRWPECPIAGPVSPQLSCPGLPLRMTALVQNPERTKVSLLNLA